MSQIHEEMANTLTDDALKHVLLGNEMDPATSEHRLTLQLFVLGSRIDAGFKVMGEKIDALPAKIAEAMNGDGNGHKRRRRDVVREKTPAVIGWGSLFGAIVWVIKVVG